MHRAEEHPQVDKRPKPLQVYVHPDVLPPTKVRLSCVRCRTVVRDDCLDLHYKNCHPPDKPSLPPVPPREVSAPVVYRECQRCGERVRDDCTELHRLKCRRPVVKVKPLNIPTQRLPFTLLPAGQWKLRDVIGHYRNASYNFPTGLLGRTIDESRLLKIGTLTPLQCYIGNETWSGYVVFEFAYSDSVVLECPFEGNATYILPSDWKTMAGHTKDEIRRLFENRYTKVVHKNDWLSRIREALR